MSMWWRLPPRPWTRRAQPRLVLLLGRFGLRQRRFDIFKGELELVGRHPFEPLAPRTKALIVRLAKKVMHMLVEALQLVTFGHKLCLLRPFRVALLDRRFAFGNRNIALGDGLRGQHAQALKIVRKRISRRAHAPSRARCARECDALYRG